MEEGYTQNQPESDVQMALRLMRTLDYHQEIRSLKRSYVSERWPESSKKHKTLSFFNDKYVPECDVREEKDILVIKSLVEESIETLGGGGKKNDASSRSCVLGSSLEPSVGKVEEMSDHELVKRAPLMLCSLNKKALKSLLYTLAGKKLTSNHRYIFVREIETEFAKVIVPSGMEELPESLLKVALLMRNPSSYRHTLGSVNPHSDLFSMMPSSTLAAACQAFACVGRFPTRIATEVGKLLILDDNKDLPLAFRHKTHLQTVEAVNQEVKRRLHHLKEGDRFPPSLEGALRVIGLSARILFGHDGGLGRLLQPLSPEKLALEKDFQAAYSQVEKLETLELAKLCNTLRKGVEKPQKKKQVYIDELQRILVDSMHCIYAFGVFPEHVTEALVRIKGTSSSATRQANLEADHGKAVQETAPLQRLNDAGKRQKLLEAEIDSVLDVSAQVQSAVWACLETYLEAADRDAEASSLKLDPLEAHSNPIFSSSDTQANSNRTFPSYDALPDSNPQVVMTRLESKQPSVEIKVEVLEDEQPEEATPDGGVRRERVVHQDLEQYIQDVETFSDKAATIIYVLIGCLFRDVSMRRRAYLDDAALGYLQTGLNKLQPSEVFPLPPDAEVRPAWSETLNADEGVLGIAKKLKVIPQRVIMEAECQLREHCKRM